MLGPEDRFGPDRTRVTSEVLDGEAIVVDLTMGTYYTMDGVAASVWSMIERKHTVAQMVESVTRQYIISAGTAQADLAQMIASLLDDGLITSVDVADGPSNLEPAAERLPYITPEIRRYGDLSDLLALDLPVPAVSPWLERQPLAQ